MNIRFAAVRGMIAAYELFMLAPVLLFLYVRWGAELAGWPWIAAAVLASAAGAAACLRFNVIWKQAAGGLVFFGAGSACVLALGNDSATLAGPLIFAAGWLQGVTAPGRYRVSWYWTGVVVYFAASVVINFKQFNPQFGVPLTIGGVVCLAAVLYASGSETLRDIAFARDNPRRVPRDIKRWNILYVTLIWAGMIAMGAGLSSMLWLGFKNVLRWLFGQAGNKETPPEPPPVPEEAPLPSEQLPPAGEPGLMARIFDIVLYVISIGVIAALLFWGLFMLHRNFRSIWRRLIERFAALLNLGSGGRRGTSGFTDEETSLFSWQETLSRIRGNRLGRLLTGFRLPRYEDMPDNRAKTRFLYRRWLKTVKEAGYEIRSGLTPLETLKDFETWRQTRGDSVKLPPSRDAEALILLYNRVRYRGDDPTDEQMNAARGSQGTR